MELPKESLAHHHRRASNHRFSVPLALHDLPDKCLLSSIRKHSFSDIRSSAQCCVWNILCINSHLPLPRNETNPRLPRTWSPSNEEGSATKGPKTDITALDPAAAGHRTATNYIGQTKTNCSASGTCSDTETPFERTRSSFSRPRT